MATSNDLKNIMIRLDHLMRMAQWKDIDIILKNVNIEEEEDFAVPLTYVRFSSPVKHKLEEWKPFIKRLQNELERRGIEDSVLHGLVNKETGEPI